MVADYSNWVYVRKVRTFVLELGLGPDRDERVRGLGMHGTEKIRDKEDFGMGRERERKYLAGRIREERNGKKREGERRGGIQLSVCKTGITTFFWK